MSCPSQIRFLNQALQQVLASGQIAESPQQILYSGAAAGDANFQALLPDATLRTTDIRQSDRVDIVWNLEQEPPPQCVDAYDLSSARRCLSMCKNPGWLLPTWSAR